MSKSSSSDRTPHLVGGVDLRSLELNSTDAFVLSCVDGVSREPEIVEMTGLSRDAISRILTRLFELGVISLSSDLPPAPSPSRSPAHGTSGAYRIGPVHELYQNAPTRHPAAREDFVPEPEQPASAEPGLELDLALQRRILSQLAELPRANHYQLLGVAAEAELKTIKRAYYELANVFHPDRHFRKNLGSFRVKLEQVFTRITEAYGVLSRTQSRTEYDRYLVLSNRTRELDEGLSPLEPSPSSAAQLPAEPASSSLPPPNSEARRLALARKFGRSSPPAQRSQPPASVPPASMPPSVPPPSGPVWAANELERRYRERLRQAQHGQLDRYLALAAEAEQRSDWVAATNALRLACALSPDDLELATRRAELDQKAVTSLWHEYLERARYEEEEGQFLRAAHSYERAAAGHADARLFERAAACLLAAGRDVRRATDHARRSVQLTPDNVKCRVTLARCLLAASMRESALAELSRALELAPKDKAIKDLIRQVERGGDVT